MQDNTKGEIKMAKRDKKKVMTRILAGILAGLMVLSVAATLIAYLLK